MERDHRSTTFDQMSVGCVGGRLLYGAGQCVVVVWCRRYLKRERERGGRFSSAGWMEERKKEILRDNIISVRCVDRRRRYSINKFSILNIGGIFLDIYILRGDGYTVALPWVIVYIVDRY